MTEPNPDRVQFSTDCPPVNCTSCGHRSARIASLVSASGTTLGKAVICPNCDRPHRHRHDGHRHGSVRSLAEARLATVTHTADGADRNEPRPGPVMDPGNGYDQS